MISWTLLIPFFGRCLLAFYFLKAGINNARNASKVLGLIKSKKVPLPKIALGAVIATQIFAPIALIFNYYTVIAATALIIFTLVANFLVCNYWTMEGVQRRNVSFIFYANLAVIGALLLVSTTGAY